MKKGIIILNDLFYIKEFKTLEERKGYLEGYEDGADAYGACHCYCINEEDINDNPYEKDIAPIKDKILKALNKTTI